MVSNDIAIGYNAWTGYGTSVAIGPNTTSYSNGISLGSNAYASSVSTAVGTNVSAISFSTAVGYSNSANNYSTALGNLTVATGKYATSMGYSTTAQSAGSTVVGQFNRKEGNTATWVATDPLFVIGNGQPAAVAGGQPLLSNAFVVSKNGDVTMTGKITIPRQGDISMGMFGGQQ